MDIKTLAEQYNDYIIDRRRYYHTCPELSGEEKNTRAHLKEDLEALGITQGLLYFVLYIGRHPGCTPSDLSAALHADSGHTTRSIHKLEETGFVIRKAHPTDRRASVLELTDKGRQTMEASRGMFAEWDAYLLEQVPEDQCRQLRELLQTLLPHLRYSPAIPDRPDGPPALRGRMPE